MSSTRMEKYADTSYQNMSRTQRNQQVYTSTDISELSRIKTNTNVSIISDAPKEIDIEKIKKYINSMDNSNDENKRRISLELPQKEEIVIERKEEKDYDINTILEKAKDKRSINYEEERYKKLNNTQTQLDILRSIKIKEEESALIDEDTTGPIEELNTEEKTIVELIQNIQNNKSAQKNKKDLFEDLMGDEDDTVVMGMASDDNKDEIKDALLDMTRDLESIKEPENDFTQEINLEKDLLKLQDNTNIENNVEDDVDNSNDDTNTAPKISTIDKSFYTNSMTFNKSDFEGFEELEKEGKSGITKVAICLIIIMLLATIFLILNFVLDLNLL